MRFHPGWLAGAALAAALLAGAAGAGDPEPTAPPENPDTLAALPRLVDLGAGKCIPCKKMAPILETLRKKYAGIVDVVFIDVWKDPKEGRPYKIRLIPTQVFFDRSGKEVFRHEGFFSKQEIEKVFREKLDVVPLPDADDEDDEGGPGEDRSEGRI